MAVELAILLSFLLLAGLGIADLWLLCHRASIVQQCAISGAAAGVAAGPSAIQPAVNETANQDNPDAAWVDRLVPTPIASWAPGQDGNGFSYLDVTVTYTPDGSVFAYKSTGVQPIRRTVRMMLPP
ncbi:hypothetical protein [Paludisphaera sp.]|uniref:hypothetical protein n=1 Tax=Paludisphaera sp. TaxID=2017432 RepID=UPI00301CEEE8